ncbi:lytic transglycosylase domain-containing protein [Ramlibacter alkalitolerans]|uniref:Lytic transglycosylase domain-containing protein n=1 Tax=Ramlibacter alkalitolerans TaxID=2039631 RepID=A0ABS1JU53_9BURK|nr:lytic transglycosylase domain-containing protein [Ramlibacter alkalitolerans]MBL0427808.1 lytic transglycosylase domain-containing protein [Ramlibacter alkalitolerans]
MMQQCAPDVGTQTLAAIMRVESNGNPFSILDNGPAHLPYSQRKKYLKTYAPKSKPEAIAVAKYLLQHGRLLDLGLMQINSRNVERLGLTLEQVFDPCMNIKTGAHILKENYAVAKAQFGDGQKALRHALSMYNTGSLYAGAEYVDKIVRAAGVKDGSSILNSGGTRKYAAAASVPATQPRTGFAQRATVTGVNPYTAPATVQWK